MVNHRDSYLDSNVGKRVKVWFKDGDVLIGQLCFMENHNERYALKNVIDHRNGRIRPLLMFRKSHVRKMEICK